MFQLSTAIPSSRCFDKLLILLRHCFPKTVFQPNRTRPNINWLSFAIPSSRCFDKLVSLFLSLFPLSSPCINAAAMVTWYRNTVAAFDSDRAQCTYPAMPSPTAGKRLAFGRARHQWILPAGSPVPAGKQRRRRTWTAPASILSCRPTIEGAPSRASTHNLTQTN